MLEGGATVLGSDDSLVLDYVVIQGTVKHNYYFGGWWLVVALYFLWLYF